MIIYKIRPIESSIVKFLNSIDDCFAINVLSTTTPKMPRIIFMYRGKIYFVRVARHYMKTVFSDRKKKIKHKTLENILNAGGNIIVTYSLEEFVSFFLGEVLNA